MCDVLLKKIHEISWCINAHLLFLTEGFGILHYMAQATVQNWNLKFLIPQLSSNYFIVDLQQLAQRYFAETIGNSLNEGPITHDHYWPPL